MSDVKKSNLKIEHIHKYSHQKEILRQNIFRVSRNEKRLVSG